jgi:aspartokinase
MSLPSSEDNKDASSKPLRQDASDRIKDSRGRGETEFEKKRGINAVEVRHGLTRAYVSALPEPILESRLAVLAAVRGAGVSIDFVKFASGAISFVADQSDHKKLEAALKQVKGVIEIVANCCIVSVHAVNMQDEEGLVARIVSEVIASGEHVDHVGDMHDRLLLVTDAETGDRLAKSIGDRIQEVAPNEG